MSNTVRSYMIEFIPDRLRIKTHWSLLLLWVKSIPFLVMLFIKPSDETNVELEHLPKSLCSLTRWIPD